MLAGYENPKARVVHTTVRNLVGMGGYTVGRKPVSQSCCSDLPAKKNYTLVVLKAHNEIVEVDAGCRFIRGGENGRILVPALRITHLPQALNEV